MEQNILEGNKLIARFEGRKWLKKYTIDDYGGDTGNAYPEMKYNLSWDWLLPAISKLYAIAKRRWCDFGTIFGYFNGIKDEVFKNNIKAAFNHFVEAIRWYNQHK